MKRAATHGEEPLSTFALLVTGIEMLAVAAIICYACMQPSRRHISRAAPTTISALTAPGRGSRGQSIFAVGSARFPVVRKCAIWSWSRSRPFSSDSGGGGQPGTELAQEPMETAHLGSGIWS